MASKLVLYRYCQACNGRGVMVSPDEGEEVVCSACEGKKMLPWGVVVEVEEEDN